MSSDLGFFIFLAGLAFLAIVLAARDPRNRPEL